MDEKLIQALQQQAESQNRLAEAIEQNNQLVIQVLQVNSALLESLSDDEFEDMEPVTYLDGSKVSQ